MARASDVDGQWVARQREANRPWSMIARMAGCAEADLRWLHDPRRNTPPLARTQQTPFETARAALVRARMPEEAATIVARLWMARGAWKARDSLTRGIAVGRNGAIAMKAALDRAGGLGIGVLADGTYFSLSEDGVRAVNAMLAEARGE